MRYPLLFFFLDRNSGLCVGRPRHEAMAVLNGRWACGGLGLLLPSNFHFRRTNPVRRQLVDRIWTLLGKAS